MIALRLQAQLLAGRPERRPAAVARRLLAVQGQDARGVRLAIRARTRGLSAADVDHALTEERSLVIGWLNRGTLHLVCSDDYFWLHALTAPPRFTGNARRLEQEGVTQRAAERAVAVIERSLAAEGPLTRAQLGARIADAGVRTENQALVHLLMLASLRGLVVRGPMVGRQQAYVLVRDWIGAPTKINRDRALAELARRYLAGHGPAGERDLAYWAGLPLRDARVGLKAIGSELEARADGLVDLPRQTHAPKLPSARLLGAFDPLLLGWSSREPLLGAHDARVVRGGVFRPVALIRGRAVATWRLDGHEVKLEPFAPIGDGTRELFAEMRDVVRYLTASARQPPPASRRGS